MNITINNKAYELPEGGTVADAVALLGLPSVQGIALAVNSDVIPRHLWAASILNEQDKLMIIKATQGG